MKPIKKSELRILKKSTDPQPLQEPVTQSDAFAANTPIIEQPLQPQIDVDIPAPEYLPPHLPVYDSPLVQSVGNSGWQVSDIWRDLRVDGFCD
ncbi:conserved hypothetical protein (plasmid) [Trichormus variabilis ATCC 29413]|uniref:Uncharacterized protein n=3 Tax=Nostocaceae TaxID=1162 RepID=Q3M2R8_TRIV2|nr:MULTISPECIES: hypothetical protein [Nostocaceae]ABA24718.1 conserved hypothetical protein [Trichormus variabilis ATCC 29413]MBC1217903.1 hypothetical protein [Trichormus variabilis ARAD]MBC1259336.1 hypothetical protein [Trichormus variabilis V5]MBC1270650.1 hypothetical protein [Trichormus variabilis FSR]MBC1305550.1 hypothetical protein [Trichormus variabilis N2B]